MQNITPKKISMKKNCILVLGTALMLAIVVTAASPVLADKPSWAGGKNKAGKHEQKEKHEKDQYSHDGYSEDQHHSGINVSIYFGDHHRNVIRNYYTEQLRSGHCPPGLAKKNNGCMPPGQAKKWQVGRPLPREVIYYDLPPAIVVELGPPPSGHRFVRVASDILLIAVGTGMVVDAIQDLSEM
jgi:Ni/Co efflux regulator RcnB